ncbi:MAG: hypothetical protein AAGA78_14140 [Pseudomonadota bacterium]
MSFVRPEIVEAVKSRLSHPVEAVTLVALFGVGAWLASNGLAPFSPVLFGLGVGFGVLGVIAARAFALRARFRRSGDPGLVRVDEGHIAYFGPEGGGFVALTLLEGVDLMAHPHRWVLRNGGGEDVIVPACAKGIEALFDALAALPGFSADAALAALERQDTDLVMIWARSGGGAPLPN